MICQIFRGRIALTFCPLTPRISRFLRHFLGFEFDGFTILELSLKCEVSQLILLSAFVVLSHYDEFVGFDRWTWSFLRLLYIDLMGRLDSLGPQRLEILNLVWDGVISND